MTAQATSSRSRGGDYTVYTTGSTIAAASASNARVTATGAIALTGPGAAATVDVNTFCTSNGATGATTITNNATGTLRLGANGGLLVANTAATIIVTGGKLTAGGATNAAGEISIYANSTTNNINSVTVNSVIANNGTGAVSLALGGTQTNGGSIASLTAANTLFRRHRDRERTDRHFEQRLVWHRTRDHLDGWASFFQRRQLCKCFQYRWFRRNGL